MLRSYWLPFVAVAGLALSNPVFGHDVGHSPGGDSANTHGGQIPSNSVQPAIPLSVKVELESISAALKAIKHGDTSPHDKDHSNAEQKVADWTPWFWGVAFLELVITGLGVALVSYTLKEARKSTKEARRAADAAEDMLMHARNSSERELRAWVDIDATLTDFSITNEHTIVGIELTLKNIGKTPAPNTWISCDVKPHSSIVIKGTNDPVIVNDPMQMPPLLPNGIAMQKIKRSIKSREIEELTKSLVTAAAGIIVTIDVIAYYRTIFDNSDAKRHLTSVRFHVYPTNWVDLSSTKRRKWILEGPDGLSSVMMVQDNSGPAYAD